METIFDKIRQYNYWNGEIFSIGFERSKYLDRISKYLDNKLIKVLVGQRRVGKSYILRQIMNFLVIGKKVNPKNIFYLNKEYLAFEDIKTADDLDKLFQFYKKKIRPKGKIYLFLDEIQNIVAWETIVNNYAQDFTQDYELFITGSNSQLLSGELATLLSGRYVEFDIYPFSFFEFSEYKNLPADKKTFISYLQTGGLPETLHFEEDEITEHYVESLKNTIILRDIIERYKVKDVSLLEDILKFLTVNIGNLTSISRIVKYFKSQQRKTNYETLSSYVSYLVDTFIIHEVERYQIRGKQSLAGVRKYYLNDLAFKNYLFGFYPSDIGYNLENYVFVQLKRMGYKVSVGVINGNEIDFVAEKGGKTLYFQVAYLLSDKKTAEREFGNLLMIKDNYEKTVISLDDIKFSEYQGIKHIFPWELK